MHPHIVREWRKSSFKVQVLQYCHSRRCPHTSYREYEVCPKRETCGWKLRWPVYLIDWNMGFYGCLTSHFVILRRRLVATIDSDEVILSTNLNFDVAINKLVFTLKTGLSISCSIFTIVYFRFRLFTDTRLQTLLLWFLVHKLLLICYHWSHKKNNTRSEKIIE